MDGIVTFLDRDHYLFVEEIWAELKREFSVDGVYITPFPHFSYHIALDYDVAKVEPVLHRLKYHEVYSKNQWISHLYWSLSSPLHSSCA